MVLFSLFLKLEMVANANSNCTVFKENLFVLHLRNKNYNDMSMSNETIFISGRTLMFLKLRQGHFTSAVGSRQRNFPAISLGVAQAFFHFTFLIYLNKFLWALSSFPLFVSLLLHSAQLTLRILSHSEDTVLNFSHWNCSPPRWWKCNIASPPSSPFTPPIST